MLLILISAGAYVGWNIGANDTANCIGTTVGSGLLSFKRAVIIVAVFVILGAILQGEKVMYTIGEGIVKSDLSSIAVCTALICSGIFVTLATFLKISTSTSQAIVGGVVGIGLAIEAEIDYSKFISIAGSWIICPVLVMVLAFVLSILLKWVLKKINTDLVTTQHVVGRLAVLSACYVAFSMGANNAGNAIGPITGLDVMNPFILLCLEGVSIALGAITYGKKVADTIGKGITPLDVKGAFVAQIASAFGMHMFSMLGIPVSTSSAVVGAVIGVGLVKGAKAIRKQTIFIILGGWVLTPFSAALSAYLIYVLLIRLLMSG